MNPLAHVCLERFNYHLSMVEAYLENDYYIRGFVTNNLAKSLYWEAWYEYLKEEK